MLHVMPPLDGLAALIAGYSPAARERKPVAVLQACVDDSVKQLGRRTLFVAGYVNYAEKWVEFSQAWDRELKVSKPIAYMHMVDAKAARKQFAGWGQLDRELKVQSLAHVIANTQPWSFHISIHLRDIEQAFGRAVPYGFQTPYMICFIAIVTLLARRHREMGLTMATDFIFDEQHSIHRNVNALYEGLEAMRPPDYRDLMGSTPIFRSDKDVLPLQAADMLVWHVQREMRDGALVIRRPASKMLMRSHFYGHIDRERLARIAPMMKSHPGTPHLISRKNWFAAIEAIEEGLGPQAGTPS